MEMEEKTALKKAFFDFFEELYKLDASDEDEDRSGVALMLRQSKGTYIESNAASRLQPKHDRTHNIKTAPLMQRTVSAPLPQVLTPVSKEMDVVKDTPMSTAVPALLRQSSEAAKIAKRKAPRLKRTADGLKARTLGKRKRVRSLVSMPESQQIFQGLAFCKDTHPLFSSSL